MEKFQSLADYLGTSPVAPESSDEPRLVDITDGKAFALAVLESREFRQFIVNGITMQDLPTPIILRLMDHAWGKPVDRVEHTGKDGQPIETVTEIRRVVVHAERQDDYEDEAPRKALTH